MSGVADRFGQREYRLIVGSVTTSQIAKSMLPYNCSNHLIDSSEMKYLTEAKRSIWVVTILRRIMSDRKIQTSADFGILRLDKANILRSQKHHEEEIFYNRLFVLSFLIFVYI